MIYTITALTFLILSLTIWDNKKMGNRLLVLAVIWLVAFEGFRWEIGTDWIPYYDFFMYGNNEHMGLAYTLLNEFVRKFTDNFTAITLLIAVVTYVTLFFLFRIYSPAPIMSILIYYCSMMGVLGSNRQFIAIAICIGSLYFVFNKKPLHFLGAIAIAATFHVSSLIFIPAYYLYRKRVSSRIIMIMVILAYIISLTKLINNIPFVEYLAMMDNISSGTTSLQSYLYSFEGNISILGSLKRIFFVCLALEARNKIKDPNYDYFLYLYATGTIIYLLFNGSLLQLMAGRGAVYYSISECLVIPYVVLNFSIQKKMRRIVWIGFFTLYFYLMWRDMNSYFISGMVDIYNPYKNVLF